MLKVNNLKKEYTKGETVLNNLNIIFRDKEFVSILGASGSGKSTFLHILGGLDKEYEGEIFLNNENISRKRLNYYDRFHNRKVGFVFQDYNLIENYSVYQNIELALLIGKERQKKEKVIKALTEVGILNHLNKKAKDLSGGEKQRIAIARAIVNNPDIILLDEPTGALDSVTSNEIMDLIKKLSKDRLVIMVTHDESIARKYSTRIVTIKDGCFCQDTNPCIDENSVSNKKNKKVGFSFVSSFKLALKNLNSKRGRNILTLLGFSISLIGLSFVFAIKTGFINQVSSLKENTLANYPIIINSRISTKKHQLDKIYSLRSDNKNNINSDVLNYLSKLSKKKILGVTYNYYYNFNIISKNNNNNYKFSNELPFIAIPNDNDYLEKNYELLKGRFPSSDNEVLIKLDNDNNIDKKILTLLDINKEELSYDELLNKELKIVLNDSLYSKNYDLYQMNSIDRKLYDNVNNISLVVTGIIKPKDSLDFNTLVNEEGGGIYYKNNLIEKVIEINSNSEIVINQINNNYSIFTKEAISDEEKGELLNSLGNKQYPFLIYIYPKNYQSKLEIVKFLNKFPFKEKKLKYNDLGNDVIEEFKNIIFSITTILIIFSFIALIVTLILISVITYTSVLERKKEIGILKTLGARNKDVRGIFIKEVILISFISCIISISIVKVLINPINRYLFSLTELKNLVIFSQNEIFLIMLISIVIAVLGSFIPIFKISFSNIIKNIK